MPRKRGKVLIGGMPGLHVRLLHRTVKDFLESNPIWETILDATGHESFNPEERWANGFLWALKTSDPSFPLFQDVWDTFTWCIEYALRLEETHDSVQFEYLDEVGRVGMIIRQQYRRKKRVDPFQVVGRRTILHSFLDVAAWFNLMGYVRIKAKSVAKAELKDAWDCAKQRDGPLRSADWLSRKTALSSAAERPQSEVRDFLTSHAVAQEKSPSKTKRKLLFVHRSQ
jgi:hypothetical protein